jgi:hypothetical protein
LKLVLFCLAVGVIPAAGETHGAPSAPITLYTQFQNEPPQAVLDGLREELESIMQPIGLRFEWRSLNHATGYEVSVELAVITVKGRCDTTGLINRSKVDGALGFTHISDGQILPFTELNCDHVRNFVQGELLVLPVAEREAALGRALGRVLAHELYHIFANTTRHGSGVAKEAYTIHDLLGEDFEFQHRETEMLRSNRVRPPADPASSTAGGV